MGVSAEVASAHALSNLYWLDRRILQLMASSSRLDPYRRDNHRDGISRSIDDMGRRERTDGVIRGRRVPKAQQVIQGHLAKNLGQASSLWIVQSTCDQTSCTAQCGASEILVTARTGGPKRNAALIPTDRTATCRTRVPANSPLVAVCAAMPSP